MRRLRPHQWRIRFPTNMSSSVKWCFLAILLSGAGSSADQTARSYNRLCTSADTPGMCLIKGVLKNALLYMARKHVVADKSDMGTTNGGHLQQHSKGIEEYLMEQIQSILGMFSLGFDLPAEVTAPWSLLKSSFLGRGKKNKNLGPMLAAGVAVMAGTLMPILFGMLFMLAGKAIMTSLMAITISGLLGLKSLFSKHEGGHVKAYPAPAPHYTEAQFEQELGVYKGQTEAKMHSTSANFYAGESNLSGYYKGAEQLTNGSNQPEYYATGTGPKFHGSHGENNKITVDKDD